MANRKVSLSADELLLIAAWREMTPNERAIIAVAILGALDRPTEIERGVLPPTASAER